MALPILAGPTQNSHPNIIHPPPPSPSRSAVRRKSLLLLLSRSSSSPSQTKQIHAHILRSGHLPSPDPSLAAALIRLYSSHRRPDLSVRVFLAHFPSPPTFAWNLLIRAHTSNSSPLRAVLLYNRMLLRRVVPDKFTFPFALKACVGLRCLAKGKEVHAYSIKTGLFSNNLFLHNLLIHFYLSCGCPDYAHKLFDRMRVRTVVSWTALLSGLIASGRLSEARRVFEAMPDSNVVSWTAMIDGCARNGRPEEALELFRRMLDDNVRPNGFTLVALLVACTELGSLPLGRWIHEFARDNGRLDVGNVYIGTALIDMYSKCGSLEDAVGVFDGMRDRSVATWNAMITSFGVHGYGRKAVELFERMEREGDVEPDAVTLVGVLCACAREGMVEEGFRWFRHIVDKYEIVAGVEHYRCLMELLDCRRVEYMVEDLVMELDDEARRMLLTACREEGGSRDLEDIVSRCIVESEGGGADDSSPGGGGCFEWEIG
ncbi:pentatricopeptide repeat-containing protein-like, chloroplastic [Iris pallida]|uniref:Pentatricopeptide repeat-containing protein-like, chloroplastic n=1 Tax=Iris pallida TaxID=29817 RepID=A0AAX6GL73_IRIPA|nr:pentatricopeptide repeat-containing protein-like, chloroplastic [Iris pallida]